MPKNDLVSKLNAIRDKLAAAAQEVVDEWEQDEEEGDTELGFGGICDRVADAMASVIINNLESVEIGDGSQEGDDHQWVTVYDDDDFVIVDIHPSHYETGGGYNWRKVESAEIRPEHIHIERLGDPSMFVDDEDQVNTNPNMSFSKLIKMARQQGWEVKDSGGRHIKLVPPDKTKPIVTIARSASDWRAFKNALALMRRSGLVFDNPFYLSVQEDDGEIESFGPMSTAKLSFEDVQVEHVAEFVVDASRYTWKELGALIREQRETLELTRGQLAEKAGVSKAYLGAIERGDEPAKMTTVNVIAHAMGFSIDGRPTGETKVWKRKSHGYKKAQENPVVQEMREQLHPSDIRQLERLEFEAVFYHDMADLLYLEDGMEDLADTYSELADDALDKLEAMSSEVIESGEPLTGGSEYEEGFTFDVQEFMISAWAKYLLHQTTGRHLPFYFDDVPDDPRSQLIEYIRNVLKNEFSDFRPTTTDQELLDAAEDAYEGHIEHRMKQLTGLRGAAAPIYLPTV